MSRLIKKCEYCNGTGLITILLNTGCVYDGWEEPIYDDIPCEECGGTGLNAEDE